MSAGTVLGGLACLLFTAAWYDLQHQRIPNWLVLAGGVLGVACNGLLSPGFGFNSVVSPGALGWLGAVQGMGLGLGLLLPLYLLRAMGAGDVKLMAMVGAFIGPGSTIGAVVFTFLAGGAMALALALRTKMLAPMLQNIRLILLGGMIKASAGKAPLMDDLPVSVGKLPYGVAIASGTFGWLMWERWGNAISSAMGHM